LEGPKLEKSRQLRSAAVLLFITKLMMCVNFEMQETKRNSLIIWKKNNPVLL